MRRPFRLPYSLFVVIAVLVFSLFAAGASVAQDIGAASIPDASLPADLNAPAAPIPGGPGFLSQTALAFHGWPRENIPTYYNGVSLRNPDSASSHAYEAMIDLPHGAVITKFVVWVYDNNATSDVWVVIARAGMDGSGIAQIARVDSTGASTSTRVLQDTTILTPKVDRQNYFYWVEAYLPPNNTGGVVSFRIDYDYPLYLPAASK